MESPQSTNSSSAENTPEVVVRNEPKQSEYEVDKGFNEMRVAFVPHIKELVREHELFRNEETVQVTFAQKGVSSIVAIIETKKRKLVLKIPRSKDFSAGEGQFLQVWEEAGVTVPHVEEVGELYEYPYTMMEFIDAPTLDSVKSNEQLVEQHVFVEMGKTLRKMHSPKAEGFGFVVEGKPEFETVEEWLQGKDMQTRFTYVEEHNLLGELKAVLPKVLETIKEHFKVAGSTYCHDDFFPSNIFATEPITVFDPSPKFNTGYYDLGRVRFGDVVSGGPTVKSGGNWLMPGH